MNQVTNTIEMIRQLKVGDTVQHHTKEGTFTYTILSVQKEEQRPVNFKVIYEPKEEEL